MSGAGPAYPFWERMERERIRRRMTKVALSAATAAHTDDGQPIARTTIDELRTARRTSARVVHALAAVLGIPIGEAEKLAGLAQPRRPRFTESPTLLALQNDPTFTDEHRALLMNTATALLELQDAQEQQPNLRVVPPAEDATQAG